MGSLGSSKHVLVGKKHVGKKLGFYGRLHRFSTADEWNVLRPRSVIRKRKSQVFEVEFIFPKRKRGSRISALFVHSMYAYISYNSSNLFILICVPGSGSARVSG